MGFIGKTELAREFSPGISDDAARKRLQRWIDRNEELCKELDALGYDKNSKLLTDTQASVIREYLGA